jgi:glycylpeptide N-tetradecanoyltransferase
LAPKLIQEVTRRSYMNDIFYGTFTAGILIPTPFGRGRYYHRDLNVTKLIDINYTYIPSRFDKTENPLEEMISYYNLEKKIENTRPFSEKDIPSAMKLVNEYLKKFKYHLVFTSEEGFNF